jgi:hypothetical protein
MRPEGLRRAQARYGQRLADLSSQCVVVVVGNYVDCSWIYEVICPSACT